MTLIVWLIHHAAPIFWGLLVLITGASLWHQVRRELPRHHHAPTPRRTRYQRRP